MWSSPVSLDNETTKKVCIATSSILHIKIKSKIFQLFKRAQTQKYVIPEPKPKEEEATVFTDEDFRKFEREYFCS